MSYNPVIWMILIGFVLANDIYDEMPPDLEYELHNVMDTSPNLLDAGTLDAQNLRRNMILFNLMKTMQDDPEAFYKTDYFVDPDPVQNSLTSIEFKPPFAKRSSKTKDVGKKPTKAATKPRPRKQPNSRRQRPQPNRKPKKEIYPMCYLKLCDFKFPQL